MPRLPVLLAALLTVAAGLGVRALWDGPFADHAGDALYTVLLGSTFDPPDLFWYAVGAGAAWAVHAWLLGRRIPPNRAERGEGTHIKGESR